MTGGEACRAKLLSDDALDATIAAQLADLSKPAVLEIGKGRPEVAAAVLAHQWSAEVLAVEDARPAWWRNAVKMAVLGSKSNQLDHVRICLRPLPDVRCPCI